ncbi:acetate/propionate family kinase [Granulicoccus sp. GXG6511]|uniref:acetate/propionate family kinase n=1 Tax=Granulicoccus sp. GXG6511 TaxID=3381351 RepID=UPI003D7ECECB
MASAVLVLNCGSSSVKFALYDPESRDRLLNGLAERVGTPGAAITIKFPNAPLTISDLDQTDHHGVLARILDELEDWRAEHDLTITAVGHRLVHGGEEFASSVLLDDEAMAAVERCSPLAPLHNPANIAGVEAARAALPDIPQVGVFDTAFHQTMPPVAYRYAVPTEWYADLGVRRYGFHGTSHRYVSSAAAELLGRPLSELRMVTAHLGNGSSLAAIRDGVSVDTSMGLTPLEGLVMGTRSGDLDPGILGYIADRTGATLAEITNDLNKRSGLLGLSGLSNDMRELIAAVETGNEQAALALDVFCTRLAKYIAALAVPLGGIDTLVFTGGIGENSQPVRARVLEQLAFLGFELDHDANERTVRGLSGPITTADSRAIALVVPTDEELVIARDAHRLASTTTSLLES